MTGLKEKVGNSLKQAMRDKDAARLSTLRLINAAIKDMEIAKRGAEEGAVACLSDDEVLAILTKMVKQRRESVRAYEEGGRLELAEREQAEIEVLSDFMPRPLDADETAAAIEAAISAVGADSVRDMGKVMGSLKAQYAGRMDFATAGAAVRDRLAAS